MNSFSLFRWLSRRDWRQRDVRVVLASLVGGRGGCHYFPVRGSPASHHHEFGNRIPLLPTGSFPMPGHCRTSS